MSNKPNYENALKFIDTNYTDSNIALDKIDDRYKEKVRNIYSIQNIYITGGGYVDYPISGASPDSPLGWEEFVWRKSPSRNSRFVFNTMDDIDVGRVARCELNVKFMEYEDFLILRHIVNTERHFMVKFFDVDNKKWVCRDMYCSENTKGKLFTLKASLIGQIDVSIKLVGTNLDLTNDLQEKTYTITYNTGDSSDAYRTQSATRGSQVVLSNGSWLIAPENKYPAGWQTKNAFGEVTGSYGFNQSITLWDDLILYPWYKDAE